MGEVSSVIRRPSSNLVVPGDEAKQVAGAGGFGATQIVLDLADVDPSRKDTARADVTDALGTNDYGDALVAVRVNPIDSMWAYRDIVDIVERAGEFLDGIAVPRVTAPSDVEFVDTLVGMIEQRIDLDHRIDIEAEVGTAQGLALLEEISLASDRLTALVLDETGVLEALDAPDTAVTTNDDVLAPLRLQVLVAARAVGLQAVVAPAVDDDTDAYRAALVRARAQGYDGARCTHPVHVALANEVFAGR